MSNLIKAKADGMVNDLKSPNDNDPNSSGLKATVAIGHAFDHQESVRLVRNVPLLANSMAVKDRKIALLPDNSFRKSRDKWGNYGNDKGDEE